MDVPNGVKSTVSKTAVTSGNKSISSSNPDRCRGQKVIFEETHFDIDPHPHVFAQKVGSST